MRLPRKRTPATQMKQLMLRHAFRFANSVIFLVGPQNFRSQRAVEEKYRAVIDGTPANLTGPDQSQWLNDCDGAVIEQATNRRYHGKAWPVLGHRRREQFSVVRAVAGKA